MILYFSAQFLGYGILVQTDKDLLNAAKPIFYLIIGIFMFLLGVLDLWTFTYFPLQKNIFLDKKENLP